MSFINKWLRADIKETQAYHVPESKNITKMDAMESPFLIHQDLVAPYTACLANTTLNRYPDAGTKELQQQLRSLMDIPKGLDILLGNGSDELIQLLALACDDGDTILSFEPSFVMYEMIAKFARLNYKSTQLDENFQIDIDATLDVIKKTKPKIIFIAYPNNPTGNSFDRDSIKQIIENSEGLVVIDEAYYAYAKDSFLTEVCNYQNMVLLRTVSKIGFAGLRLGLLIGDPETVRHLDKLRLPYNINTLTQASAKFLLQEKDWIKGNAQIIIKERERLFDELNAIQDLTAYQSDANFLLLKTPDASALFHFLKENGILIKSFASNPQLKNYVRVTVSNATENNTFLEQIKKFYG